MKQDLSKPRKRGKADRPEVETPEEAASMFDLAFWPVVPKQNRPKRIIFDTLREQDVAALQARGYEVVLLRTLPRRSAEEDDAYLVALMEGVSDGTVLMSKGRSEGLSAELRSRTYGSKKELKRREGVARSDNIKDILAWQETRHRFGENTTMLDPADVQRFLTRVAEENARAAAQERLKGRKKR